MPYIAQEDRENAREHPQTPGELNYAITMQIIMAWERRGNPLVLNLMSRSIRELADYYWGRKMQNYTTINDIYGAIGCALLEFRRRVRPKTFGFEGVARLGIARAISKVVDEFYVDVAGPYEDPKIQENGDVYEL